MIDDVESFWDKLLLPGLLLLPVLSAPFALFCGIMAEIDIRRNPKKRRGSEPVRNFVYLDFARRG